MRRRTLCRLLIAALAGWICALLVLTVFGRPHTEPTLYLRPFFTTASMFEYESWYVITYLLVGNIAWFVPIGFALPYLSRMRSWLAILCGAGLSVTIEALQYLLAVGCTDIDDLIFNTLGTAIGVALFMLTKKKLPHLY